MYRVNWLEAWWAFKVATQVWGRPGWLKTSQRKFFKKVVWREDGSFCFSIEKSDILLIYFASQHPLSCGKSRKRLPLKNAEEKQDEEKSCLLLMRFALKLQSRMFYQNWMAFPHERKRCFLFTLSGFMARGLLNTAAQPGCTCHISEQSTKYDGNAWAVGNCSSHISSSRYFSHSNTTILATHLHPYPITSQVPFPNIF